MSYVPESVARREMGVYYTPDDAAAWMAQWLLDQRTRTILEPSCGDGSFVAAVRRASELRRRKVIVHAVELDNDALRTLGSAGDLHKIASDFHLVKPFPVDAAIGNPPFIRFRNLKSAAARHAARVAGQRALDGIPVDESGSTWMTIVLHAATFLRPGGRLAFVLPADSLYVRYAMAFWDFMAARFGHLKVIRCRERIFPDLLQDVILLLADRAGASTTTIISELYAQRGDLTSGRDPQRSTIQVEELVRGDKPFVRALLGDQFGMQVDMFMRNTVRADTYVKFNIGYVDANKRFFHPTPTTQDAYELPQRSLLLAVRSGRTMSGSGFSTSGLPPTAIHNLWLPDVARLSAGEKRYIAFGEQQGAHLTYKTRSRKPWYRVPDVRVPDLLMPVFGELPKLMLNDAHLVASNSLMLGFWRRSVPTKEFLLAWYSSVTRLGIELSVHSLGGGVLVVVPREADGIRMPNLPDLPAPPALLDNLDTALRNRDLLGAYRTGDSYLQLAGWDQQHLIAAGQMADTLLKWRVGR